MSKERDEKRAALGLTDRMATICEEIISNGYDELTSKSKCERSTRTWSGNFPFCDDLIDLYMDAVISSSEACYLAMERVKAYDRVNHLMGTGPR